MDSVIRLARIERQWRVRSEIEKLTDATKVNWFDFWIIYVRKSLEYFDHSKFPDTEYTRFIEYIKLNFYT